MEKSKKYNINKCKIKSIKPIGIKKCYDLSVPIYHNFFLGNGVLSHNCFASQVYDVIPERIRFNTKYVFVPRTIDVNNMRQILMDSGMFKNVQSSVNEAIKIKKMMKKIPYSWLVINKMDMTKDIITFLAPLSKHMETGD